MLVCRNKNTKIEWSSGLKAYRMIFLYKKCAAFVTNKIEAKNTSLGVIVMYLHKNFWSLR